jgi:hypothetical protein
MHFDMSHSPPFSNRDVPKAPVASIQGKIINTGLQVSFVIPWKNSIKILRRFLPTQETTGILRYVFRNTKQLPNERKVDPKITPLKAVHNQTPGFA